MTIIYILLVICIALHQMPIDWLKDNTVLLLLANCFLESSSLGLAQVCVPLLMVLGSNLLKVSLAEGIGDGYEHICNARVYKKDEFWNGASCAAEMVSGPTTCLQK